MPKFTSQEEYDDWKCRQALKRQGAKDIEKLDAEHPVHVVKKNRGIGIGGLIALLVFVAAVLFYTTPGRQLLGWLRSLFGR